MKKASPFIFALLLSCSQLTGDQGSVSSHFSLRNGHWLFNFDLGEEKLPFNAFFSNKNEKELFIVKNAEETIVVEDISHKGDSIFLNLPVFGTKLEGKLIGDSLIRGFWKNTIKGADYQIPFEGLYGPEDRFNQNNSEEQIDFSGKWEVTFSPDDEHPCKAIGLFNQQNDIVTGTFLTETGDYRYLEGKAVNNTLMLSCFDGAHAFLFKASINPEKEISGQFWSGNHWSEEWVAVKNDAFELTHPDSITYLVNEQALDLHFKGLNNDTVSLNDPQFKDKVVIIQILGSWCPNCADESRDFAELYKQYQKQGLEIIGVSYELTDDYEKAVDRINFFKKEVGADYPFVYGGKANKKANSEDFKFLNGISSYPTSLFIDRNGKIRRIHSGYYGPGTGPYYFKYKEETEMFLEKLLAEKIQSNS